MVINNIDWLIMFVQSGSPFLTRSDGSVTLGMTDGRTKTIYLDDNLRGLMLDRVLAIKTEIGKIKDMWQLRQIQRYIANIQKED